MRRILIMTISVVCAAGLGGAAQSANFRASTLRGTVTYVVDGDTVHVDLRGRNERVRLLGIDTPELGQCGAAKATRLARQLAQGRPVTLIPRRVTVRPRPVRALARLCDLAQRPGSRLSGAGARLCARLRV